MWSTLGELEIDPATKLSHPKAPLLVSSYPHSMGNDPLSSNVQEPQDAWETNDFVLSFGSYLVEAIWTITNKVTNTFLGDAGQVLIMARHLCL